MAITGTGTQADPFVVTTYSELVSKITNPDSLSECYIKVGNNIDIAEEYPFGDMPVLDFGANVFLDGDGKTITNWYYTGSGTDGVIKLYSKTSHPCWMKNLHLANIVLKSSGQYFLLISSSGSGTQTNNILVENCTFVGIFFGTVLSISWETQNVSALRSCAFNVLLKSNAIFNRRTYALPLESCNVRIVSEHLTGASLIAVLSTSSPCPHNCYFDISIPNAATGSSVTISNATYDNCVIKLRTPLGTTASKKGKFGVSASGYNVSILNTSDATGVEPDGSTQIKEVTDQNWHDIAYLQSIGFSAGERT
jgi:hypothetical protein